MCQALNSSAPALTNAATPGLSSKLVNFLDISLSYRSSPTMYIHLGIFTTLLSFQANGDNGRTEKRTSWCSARSYWGSPRRSGCTSDWKGKWSARLHSGYADTASTCITRSACCTWSSRRKRGSPWSSSTKACPPTREVKF